MSRQICYNMLQLEYSKVFMTDHSPEHSLAQFLSPENLGALTQPVHIPESAARALGGIGLGDVQEKKLPPGSLKSTEAKKSKDYEDLINRLHFGIEDRFNGYLEASEKFKLTSVPTKEQFMRGLETAIKTWSSDRTFDFAVKETDENGNWFDLIAAPVVDVEHHRKERLLKLAEGFIPGQILKERDKSGYKVLGSGVDFLSHYSPNELYGSNKPSNAKMKFMLAPAKSLIKSKYSFGQQNQLLTNMMGETGASIYTPTIIETLYDWFEQREWERQQSMTDNKRPLKMSSGLTNYIFLNLPPQADPNTGVLSVPSLSIDTATDMPIFGIERADMVSLPCKTVIGRINI